MGNIRRDLIRVNRRQRLGVLNRWDVLKSLLQSKQARANRSAEETKVTHLHKTCGQNVLEETVNEFFCGEGT